jgi:hypothetical protein
MILEWLAEIAETASWTHSGHNREIPPRISANPTAASFHSVRGPAPVNPETGLCQWCEITASKQDKQS